MFDQKIKSTMSQADALLDAANEELCRPEEDVVPYMVCSNAYKSVGKYLTGYMMKYVIEIHNSMPLDTLLNLCKDVNPRFSELDLEPIVHTPNPDDVWVDMSTVKTYIDLATQTREMVGVA